MARIPVTIITGFLGSGKTTLILNLIPQLPPTYKLALLKNEYGDVAIDSALASEASISGVRELLNGCICCNLVGQLGDALFELRNGVETREGWPPARPDRIIIETSGSAFPATLAMEVNRIARETPGSFVLDGVVSVIDVENWKGYEDTSVTAKMQANFTDLIVYNKWELVSEQAFETCQDRVGDLDVQTAWVKSQKGMVDVGVIMGIDGALISKNGVSLAGAEVHQHHQHDHEHEHYKNHQDEVEVLSVVLKAEGVENGKTPGIQLDDFETLLLSAPKDEVYRIKGLVASSSPPPDSSGDRKPSLHEGTGVYILNWAFSRWTYTQMSAPDMSALKGANARLTFMLARYESNKWKRKLEGGNLLRLEAGLKADLSVQRVG